MGVVCEADDVRLGRHVTAFPSPTWADVAGDRSELCAAQGASAFQETAVLRAL